MWYVFSYKLDYANYGLEYLGIESFMLIITCNHNKKCINGEMVKFFEKMCYIVFGFGHFCPS